MNDAISTIALGVDTKIGKEHLLELTAAFAALKAEVRGLSDLKSNPAALTGGAAQATTQLTTLTAELRRTKDQVSDLQKQLQNMSKSQIDSAKDTASAVKTASEGQTRTVIENEKRAAAETQRLARETTKVVQDEAAKRYTLGQSAKVGGVSYSMRGGSNEGELNAALAAAEKTRREILANSQAMIIAEADRSDKLRREKSVAAQQMLIADTERTEQIRREKLVASQNMLIAEVERTEALRREKSLVAQAMLIADTERAELLRREKTTTSQQMIIAEVDRLDSIRREKARLAQEMLTADIDRAEAIRREKAAAAQAMQIADLERAQARKQAILNNDFNSSSLGSQVRTVTKAKGLVDGGQGSLARELYGSEAVNSIGRLNAMHTQLNSTVSRGGEISREAARHAHQYQQSLNDVHSAARGLAGGLGQLWLTWGSIVPLVAGAAVTGSMAKIYTAGKEVEYQLQFLRALASDLNREPVNVEAFLKITEGTMESVKDAAGGMRSLSQAGMDQAKSLRALPDILNLATIGEMKVGAAALSATGVLNAFGLEIDEIGHVGDVFAKVASASNTSVHGMTESMKQASTVGEQFKVTLEETSASIGVLAQRNIIGTSAGTSLTNALKNLYEPTTKAKNALEQMNIVTNDGSGGIKNYTQLMEELAIKLSTLNDSSKAVFLGTITDQRGAKTLSAITENFGTYKKFLDDARHSTGFMSEATLQLEDTVEGASRRMKNAMEESFIRAFQDASPQIRVVLEDLQQLAKSEKVVNTLTTLAVAGTKVTQTFVENTGVILTAVAVYASLKIVASLSNAYLVWRSSVVAATLATQASSAANAANTLTLEAQMVATYGASAGMIRFAGAARMAAGALGPIALLLVGAYTAYELLSVNVDKSENALLASHNTIDTTIDFYQRQIDKLKALNDELEKNNDLTGKKAATAKQMLEQEVIEAESKRDELQPKAWARTKKKMSGGGGFFENAFSTEVEDYGKAIGDAKAKREKLEKFNRLELEFSEQRDKNLGLSSKKKVGSRIDNMIDSAGGGLFKEGGTDATRLLIPQLEDLKKQLNEGDDGTYLRIAPVLADIQKKINEGKEEYKPKNTRAENDKYRAQQATLDGELQGVKNNEKTNLADVQSKLANNQIGNLQAIAENLRIVKKAREDEMVIFQKKEDLAAASENRTRDVVTLDNKQKNNVFLNLEAEKDADRQRREVLTKWNEESLRSEADTYRKKGDLIKAFQSEFDAKNKGELDRIDSDLNSPLTTDSQKSDLNKRKGFLGNQREAGTTAADFEKTQSDFESLIAVMDERIAEVQTKAANTNGFLSDLGAVQMADAIRDETIPAANELLEKMGGLAEKLGDSKLKSTVSKMGTDLVKEAQRSQQAWIAAGKSIENSLTNAFGKGGKAVGGVISALIKQKAQQKEIDDQLAKSKGTDSVKNALLEAKAREESAQVQISSYGEMAGAAKSYFDEQSTGYKVLEAAEKTFRMAEMAMALEAFLRKSGFLAAFTGLFVTSKTTEIVAEGATVAPTIAAEGVKATAHGVTGLAAALSLPYPANIPAFAITAAMLAAIGVAVAGAGGGGSKVDIAKERQTHQGTGFQYDPSNGGANNPYSWELTKSESIEKSLDAVRENSDIALRYSSSQLSVLERISTGISGMASMVTQGSGLRGTKADEHMLGIGDNGSLVKTLLGFSSTSTELLDTGIMFDKVRASGNTGMDDYEGMDDYYGYYNGNRPSYQPQMVSQTIGSVMSGGVQAKSYADLLTEKSSWWGLSNSSSESTQTKELGQGFKDQMTMVIGDMYTSVVDAAKFLGKDQSTLEQALKAVTLESAGLTKISLKGLSSDEIEKELSAVFGNLGDQMALTAMPTLKAFQKTGEGYMTTLIRVSSGVDAASYALEKLGVTAIDYTLVANKQGDVTAEIVRSSLMLKEANAGVLNGIGEMISTFSGSAGELTDAYVKLDQVRETLAATGAGTVDITREMVRGAGGLDNLAQGVESFMESFFTEGESAAIKASLLEEEFGKLNLTMPNSKAKFKEMAESIDRSTASGQALYGSLMSLAGGFSDLSDDLGNVSPALSKQNGVVNELLKTANKWLDTVRNSRGLLQDLDSEINGKVDNAARISELQAMMSSGTADFDQQLELAGEIKDLVLEKYQVEKENAESMITFGKDLRKYVKDLKTGDLSPLTNGQKLAEAERQYSASIGKLSSSDEKVREEGRGELQGKADTLLNLAKTYYASSQGYTDIFNRVTGQLDQIGIESVTSGESIEQVGKDQLLQLTNLRLLVKDLYDRANYEYDRSKELLGRELNILQGMYEQLGIMSAIPDILRDMPAELAAAMQSYGVEGSGPQTNAQQVETMYRTLLGRHSDQQGMNFWVQKASEGITLEQIRAAIISSDEYRRVNGSHADGLDYVPYNGYVAELHEGERVQTRAEAAMSRRTDKATMATSTGSFSSAERNDMAREIRELREAFDRMATAQTNNAVAMVRAMHESTSAAADKVVGGAKDAVHSKTFKDKNKPSFV